MNYVGHRKPIGAMKRPGQIPGGMATQLFNGKKATRKKADRFSILRINKAAQAALDRRGVGQQADSWCGRQAE